MLYSKFILILLISFLGKMSLLWADENLTFAPCPSFYKNLDFSPPQYLPEIYTFLNSLEQADNIPSDRKKTIYKMAMHLKDWTAEKDLLPFQPITTLPKNTFISFYIFLHFLEDRVQLEDSQNQSVQVIKHAFSKVIFNAFKDTADPLYPFLYSRIRPLLMIETAEDFYKAEINHCEILNFLRFYAPENENYNQLQEVYKKLILDSYKMLWPERAPVSWIETSENFSKKDIHWPLIAEVITSE